MMITETRGADIDFKCLYCISDISDKIGIPKGIPLQDVNITLCLDM